MNPFKGKVQLLAILIGGVIIVVGFFAAMFAGRAWFAHPAPGFEGASNASVSLEVKPGDNFGVIASELKQDGVIDSALALRFYARVFDSSTIYPGTYTILRDSSYQDILAVLHQIESNVVRITIPEGFSLVDMGVRIQKFLPSITTEAWNAAVGTSGTASANAFIASSMKPEGVDLEGYLFPDTYEFSKDATADQIANIMIDAMKRHIDDLGAPTGDAVGMSTHEMLTLASIVEKEVRTAETMKNVADVFLKRIAIGMPLQSDATINYIIDGDNPSPLYSDLEVESPYNTYKHAGLPPGPISAPGLNALTAVFHPTSNDYYYFLTTDAGDIYYAKTYDQHLANKANHLK